MMTTVTAQAVRSGDWWAIEVPEIPGLFTQTRRLDQVAAMVQDAASMLGWPTVDVVVRASLSSEDQALVDAAAQGRAELSQAQKAAASASRRAVAKLREQGLTVRDVASLLGVSPQRVSAIAA